MKHIFTKYKSVNDGIPKDPFLSEPFQLNLPGVDAIVSLIQQLGFGCFAFRNNLRRAYRQLPVDPRDYHFFGYKSDDYLFFDKVLPYFCDLPLLSTYHMNETEMFGGSNYYLLTGCKGRTRKYKPKVFHTARACEGCLENQGLVFPGTARALS